MPAGRPAPRVPSGLESAMIPTRSGSVSRANRRHVVRGEHAAYARHEVRDAHAGIRDSVGGRPACEKSGQGLDRRFRGRPAASRACTLPSSPAATLDPVIRSAELSKYGRKAELSSAAGRRRFCSASRIYSCCVEPSHPPGERKASLCTSRWSLAYAVRSACSSPDTRPTSLSDGTEWIGVSITAASPIAYTRNSVVSAG